MNNPPPPHDPDHDRAAGRSVLPVVDGTAPVPSAAASIDWSADAASAAIGQLVEFAAAITGSWSAWSRR